MTFAILVVPVILLVGLLFLRGVIDKRMRILAHRRWCQRHLTGERRKVGELFDNRPPTHHIT